MNEIIIDRDLFDILLASAKEKHNGETRHDYLAGCHFGYLVALERILAISDGE